MKFLKLLSPLFLIILIYACSKDIPGADLEVTGETGGSSTAGGSDTGTETTGTDTGGSTGSESGGSSSGSGGSDGSSGESTGGIVGGVFNGEFKPTKLDPETKEEIIKTLIEIIKAMREEGSSSGTDTGSDTSSGSDTSGDTSGGSSGTDTVGGSSGSGGGTGDEVKTFTLTINADMSFSPNPLEATPGATIIVTNNDTVAHTVTSGESSKDTNAGDDFDTGNISPNGAEESFTIPEDAEVGTVYDYFCQYHSGMTGTIEIVKEE